jgi:hypothetical protein
LNAPALKTPVTAATIAAVVVGLSTEILVHYFHTHFNVYPNPQGKIDACNHKAAPNFARSKLRVIEHVDQKSSGREDVQQQVCAYESRAGADVREAEQHTKGHDKVQAVLKVGPLVTPIQGLAVAHPKYAIVRKVSDVPEQQQGSVVMVDEDVLVRFEESSH